MLKYLENNVIKYLLYSFIIVMVLLINLYFQVDIGLLLIVLSLFIIIDMIFGINRMKQLEIKCQQIEKGKFSEVGFIGFEEELIKLTIKTLTDDYLLDLKNIEKEQAEFEDYIQMWVHEIKLSTANIKHVINNLEDTVSSSELENIDESIERILAFSSTNLMENNNKFEKTPLSEICNTAIKLQMYNILQKDIKIVTDYDQSSSVVDKFWLAFALKQIINNAIKYGASEITVSVQNKIITISDNGIGIDSGELDLVFDKFYCGTRTKELVKSTGVGLYLVKVITAKFGYDIKLNNSQQGLDVIIDLNW